MSLINYNMIAFILSSNGPPGLIHPLLVEKYAWVDKCLEEICKAEYRVNDCQDDDEYKGDDEYTYIENIKYNTPCSVSHLYDEEEMYNISYNSVDSNYYDAGYASEQYSEVSALSNDDDIGEYDSDEWYMYSTIMY
jgi:hypothetical protein